MIGVLIQCSCFMILHQLRLETNNIHKFDNVMVFLFMGGGGEEEEVFLGSISFTNRATPVVCT